MSALHPRDLGPALEGSPAAVLLDLDAGSASDLERASILVRRTSVPIIGHLEGSPDAAKRKVLDALAVTLVPVGCDDRRTVECRDLDATWESLRAAVAQNPGAAATLTGLLRVTSGLDVEDGLVAESLAYSMLLGGSEFAAWRDARPRRSTPERSVPAVDVRRLDDVLYLTLARPGRRNALNAQMRDELLEALAIATADTSLHVELSGAGPGFSSGGDLDEFGTANDLVQAHLVRVAHSVGQVLHELSSRTKALLHGACIGAGIELPAFASHVVADPHARLQLPELRMGLVPGAGGTVSVTRRIGRWRTGYLALSGEAVDAATALAWGLIDELVPVAAEDPERRR